MGRFRAPSNAGNRQLAVAVCLVASCGLWAQEREPPVFTADVRLVTLPVTVKDQRGAPVGDLRREHFTILESGEDREIAFFRRSTNIPLSVALMVDASLSTAIELRYERESAAKFLASLLRSDSHLEDVAGVYSFSADTEVLQDLTRDQSRLRKAIGRVRPRTGTSVYDAVLLASRALAGREGARVIVLITDGGDTTSHYSFNDALRALLDAEVILYPLIVLPIRSDAGRNRGGEHALITLAKNSGGQDFIQHGAQNLDEAFAEIERSLRTQYYLSFYPRVVDGADPGGFRDVQVKVGRDNVTVLTASGYFAPPQVEVKGRDSGPAAPVSLRTMPRRGDGAAPQDDEDRPVPSRPPRRRGNARIVRPGP